MNEDTRRLINECIREINSIVREMNQVSNNVAMNAKGIDTGRFQRELSESANRYRKAASELGKLR